MPRRARMYLPGLPYHVFQRGNNREACFFDSEDRHYYLRLLAEASALYKVALHAYVLMTNHTHLLVTPECADSISRMTRVVGSRYAYFINKKYSRSGTLWEGRHKSCPIETETYLLTCYRYIELNPVRAGLIATPGGYLWSSYAANALGKPTNLVTPHPLYMGLGKTAPERCSIYRNMVAEALPELEMQAISAATHYCSPLGSDTFREHLETELGTSIGQASRGRPRKRRTGAVKK